MVVSWATQAPQPSHAEPQLQQAQAFGETAPSPPMIRHAQNHSGPVSRLTTALRLYALDSSRTDPLALTIAARMVQSLHIRPSLAPVFTQKPRAPHQALPQWQASGQLPGRDLQLLRTEAALAGGVMMAEEDEALLDVLTSLPPLALTRPAGGINVIEATSIAGQEQIYSRAFSGASPVEISVIQAQEGVVFWRVEDEEAAIICPDMSADQPLTCRFTPAANGFFQIIVFSPAKAAAVPYSLITN